MIVNEQVWYSEVTLPTLEFLMVLLHAQGTWLLFISLHCSRSGYLAALCEWLLILSDTVFFFFPVVTSVLQARKYCKKYSSKITYLVFLMGCYVLENSSTESGREGLEK